jgi:putative membrane protein
MKVFTRALLIALLSTSAAYAQDAAKPGETTKTGDTAKSGDSTKKDTAKKEKLTPTELQVVAHYHDLNQMEIELGKVAMKQSSTPAVKSYGEMLVKQHGDADKQLVGFAKKTGQTVPKEKPVTDADKMDKAEQQKSAAAVKKLKGADFDREYLRLMVEGHDKELAKIDTKMGEVQNAELADMLRATKPMLQAHADQARELQKGNAQASVGHAPGAHAPVKTTPAK